MNEFENFLNQQNPSNGYDFKSKILIPFGSFIVGVAGLLALKDKVPVWIIWVVVIYLVISLVIILTNPVKSFISKIIKLYSNARFANRMRPELDRLITELNNLLDSNRTVTIPYLITHQTFKIPNEVPVLNYLYKNQQQFTILESWSSSLVNSVKKHGSAEFLIDAIQLSKTVSWFAWTCEWVRKDLNNNEVQAALQKKVIQDWNIAVQKISSYTYQVEQIMKSINKKYGSRQCVDYFHDIKQL